MINFYSEEVNLPQIISKNISDWIVSVIKNNSKKLGEISYIFCSDSYLLNINREYLNHDYFTDIITFNYNIDDTVSGDIFISLDTVSTNAKEFNVSYENELKRVIIHGILHLVGFDDKTDDQQLEMTKQENKALNNFPI